MRCGVIHRSTGKNVGMSGGRETRACADGTAAHKMNGPGECYQHRPGPTIANLQERSEPMADTSQYPDSGTANKSEQPANWKPIGILARALAEKAAKAVAGE